MHGAASGRRREHTRPPGAEQLKRRATTTRRAHQQSTAQVSGLRTRAGTERRSALPRNACTPTRISPRRRTTNRHDAGSRWGRATRNGCQALAQEVCARQQSSRPDARTGAIPETARIHLPAGIHRARRHRAQARAGFRALDTPAAPTTGSQRTRLLSQVGAASTPTVFAVGWAASARSSRARPRPASVRSSDQSPVDRSAGLSAALLSFRTGPARGALQPAVAATDSG